MVCSRSATDAVFLGRLAALVPRPRTSTLYFGVLAGNARERSHVVPRLVGPRAAAPGGTPRGPVVALTEAAPSLGTFWTAIAAHASRPEVVVAATLDYDRVALTVLRAPP